MRSLILATAAVLALAGCGSAQASTPKDADAAFLAGISADRPNTSDAALIKTGHLTCKLIAQDVKDGDRASSWFIELAAMKGSGSFTAHQAGVMMGAAVTSYCPQYKDILPNQ